MCENNSTIDIALVNDLVPDCRIEADDEPILKHAFANNECSSSGKLTCKVGHSRCYEITEICIYRLDIFDNLYPCRNGAHIEECENFQCNKQH